MFTQATAKVITDKYSLEQFSPHTELNDTNDDSDSMAISSSTGMDSNGEPNEEAPVDFYNKNKPPLNDLASNPHVGRLDGSDDTPSTEELGEHIAEVEEEKAQDINSATQSYAMQGMTMTADGIAVQGNMTEFRHSVETAGSGLIFNSGKDVKSGWVSDGKGTSAYMDEDGNIFDSNGWGFSDPDQSLWEVARDAAGSIIEAVRGVVEKVGQAVKDRNDETENDNTSGGSGYSTGPKSNEEKTPLDWGDDLPEEEDEAPRGDLTQEEWDAYVQEEWEKAYDEAIAAGKNKGEAEAYANAVAEAMEALAQSGGFAKGGSTATASNWSDPDYEPTYGFDPDESDDSDDSGSEEDDLAWLDEEDEESSGSGSTEGNGNTTETTPQESDPSTSGAEGGSSDDSRETNNDDPADSSSNLGTGTSTTSTGPSATTVSSTSTSPGNGWPGYGTTTSTTGKGTGSGTVSVSKPEPTQPKTQNTSQKPDTGAQEDDQPQDTDSDALTKLQSLLSRLEELLEKLQQGDDLDPKKEIQGILKVLDAIKDVDKSPWGDLLGGAGRSLQEALDSLNGPLFAEGGGGLEGGGGKPTPGREGTGLQGKPAESEGNQDNESDANNSDQPSSPKGGGKAPGVKPEGNNPQSDEEPASNDPTSPKATNPKTPSGQDPKKGPTQSDDGPKDSESEAEQPSSPKGDGKAPGVKPAGNNPQSDEEPASNDPTSPKATNPKTPSGQDPKKGPVKSGDGSKDSESEKDDQDNESVNNNSDQPSSPKDAGKAPGVKPEGKKPQSDEKPASNDPTSPKAADPKTPFGQDPKKGPGSPGDSIDKEDEDTETTYQEGAELLLQEAIDIYTGYQEVAADDTYKIKTNGQLYNALKAMILGAVEVTAFRTDDTTPAASKAGDGAYAAGVRYGWTELGEIIDAWYDWDPSSGLTLMETMDQYTTDSDHVGAREAIMSVLAVAGTIKQTNTNEVGITWWVTGQAAQEYFESQGRPMTEEEAAVASAVNSAIFAVVRWENDLGKNLTPAEAAKKFIANFLLATSFEADELGNDGDSKDEALLNDAEQAAGYYLAGLGSRGNLSIADAAVKPLITEATGKDLGEVHEGKTVGGTIVRNLFAHLEQSEGFDPERFDQEIFINAFENAYTAISMMANLSGEFFTEDLQEVANDYVTNHAEAIAYGLELAYTTGVMDYEAYESTLHALEDALSTHKAIIAEIDYVYHNYTPSGAAQGWVTPVFEEAGDYNEAMNAANAWAVASLESIKSSFLNSYGTGEFVGALVNSAHASDEGNSDGSSGASGGAIGNLREFGFYGDQRGDESGWNENEDRGTNLHLQASNIDIQFVGVNFDFMYSDNF